MGPESESVWCKYFTNGVAKWDWMEFLNPATLSGAGPGADIIDFRPLLNQSYKYKEKEASQNVPHSNSFGLIGKCVDGFSSVLMFSSSSVIQIAVLIGIILVQVTDLTTFHYDDAQNCLLAFGGTCEGTLATYPVCLDLCHNGDPSGIGFPTSILDGVHLDRVKSLSVNKMASICVTGGEDGRLCLWR